MLNILFSLVFLFQIANSEWRLIESQFYQENLSNLRGWEFKKTCTDNSAQGSSIRQCQSNPLDIIRLKEDRTRIEKEFYYPHYQLRIITDVFYIRAKSSANSEFKISLIDSGGTTTLFSRLYQASTIQSYDKVCKFDCSGSSCGGLDETKIELKTVILNGINHQKSVFDVSYCYLYQDDSMRVGLRNILIYVNTCHFTCASCSGSTEYDCLTCYQGGLQGGICKCDESNSYVSILTGCSQECPRDYYLADDSKYCQFDSRIQSKFSYFTSTSISNGNLLPYDPWVYVPDPFYPSNTNKLALCGSDDVIGRFSNYEMIYLKLDEHKGLKFLRIRASFYLFGWQTGSSLRITVDSYSQGLILKTASNYTVQNARLNKFSSSSCSGNNYDLLRIETILKTYTTTPIIKIQGVPTLQTEYWAFKNITIDYGLCQSNCTSCETYSRCLICDSGFQLYRGTCVNNCPIHTTLLANGTCQDFEDLIQNSRYLIKAFYDMNTTFEGVSSIIDNFTDLAGTIKTSFTGSIYSFVPEKSVLGGALVWQVGKFQKTFNSLKPHYKISYRLNVTYGDEMSGWFSYKFHSFQSSQLTNPNTGTSNSIGDVKKETTVYYQLLEQLHSSPQLDIVLAGNTNQASLEDAFLYVSEYFVVVHYCAPFCNQCNGPAISDCLTGQYSGYSLTQYCNTNQYLNFNSATQVYSCQTCNQLGCLECQSDSVCTKCEFSNTNKFLLDQGECQCYPSAYLSATNCIQCNQYCETCFGSLNTQCYTCVSEFYRSIKKYQCQCIDGYYDDGYNLQCLPICGDQIVVDGEDCDDGNNNPFDGCYQCKYACQESCQDCQNGKCYECKDNYIFIESIHKCINNCGDSIIIGNEECDDGNIYPYDGCYECQFQCYENCTECIFGICYKCDENNGWYLTGVNCEPICGDGILVQDVEQCDDQNYNPFDRCDMCQLNCSEYCLQCSDGNCVQCIPGFKYVSVTKQCIPICGDFLIVAYEECDDNNFVEFDGCYQCEFKCQTQCTDCRYGTCYECNTPGWELNFSEFIQYCDDGNIIPMDGCYQQYYECQDSCNVCYKGYCIFCKKNWYLNLSDNLCYPICGDQVIVGNEECDDKNTLMHDSCNQCFFQCDTKCQQCDFGDCLQCEIGYFLLNNKCIEICGDGLVVGNEQCDSNEKILDSFCLNCKYNCGSNCSLCTKGGCQQCKEGYLMNNYECQPICGDKIRVEQEQCDDGNDQPFDGCHNCQFQCQEECLDCRFNYCYDCMIGYLNKNFICIENCGNSLSTKNEKCDDGNLEAFDGCYNCNYSCDEECEICQEGLCFKCINIGWQINKVNYQCEPICGDQIVVGNEFCDDGNDIRYDGCFECYYECEQACTNCVKGICQECNTLGWLLEDFKCVEICGDLIIVGNEQCDDGNNIPYDGCFDCEYQCQIQCTNCNKGICEECNTYGWILVDQQCSTYCGDGIVVQPYELCDDGNQFPFDGCFDCDFQCQEICGECIEGRCYRCDELGWIIENFICVPYCGDGLIVGNEQCDSGKQVDSFCKDCILVCDKYCIDCIDGICNLCDQGRQLQNNYCISLCGDGILVDEDCDDGNLDNGDGCSESCKVENDWVCLNIQFLTSSCLYSITPIMKLNNIQQNPESVEMVSITFNQPMMLKYDENYTADHYFRGNITNLLFEQYTVNFEFRVPPKFNQVDNIEAVATIKFYENIDDPILIVILNQSAIVTQYYTIIIDNEKEIRLQTPIVLSSSQISISENAKSFLSIVIYFMITLSAFCIITGSFEIFWNLMDLLQYLSYIKYINIQFPTNLNIYFEVFKLISIQPLMEFTGISSIFSIADGEEEYIVETSDKFKQDQINGYFYNNFQSSIFCFLGLFFGYIIAKSLTQFLYTLGPYQLANFGFYPTKFIYIFRNILRKSYKAFYFSAIIKMIMSNYYDISFSVFIQLNHFNTDNIVLQLNSYAALVVCALQLLFFTYMFTKQLSFTKKVTTKNIEQYSALFEGVADSTNIWITQYNTILLLKKQIFIFLIVYMGQNGPLQTIMIGLIQTIFLLYVFVQKPLQNVQEYYKILVAESLLAFNTLLFLTYQYRLQLELSIDDYIMIGWIHIASFSFILLFSLIFDIKSQASILYKRVIKMIHGKQPEIKSGTVIFY
ncbi:unnamed protein product [Paramecium pentaurelia]|uniref:EGF-like domain-containing protein n=1 Tax=Paramecium pentaurelia TaxID=43138 RepID=A0A8S1SRD6_9CILI|nr:unnamed protein product [Paramecium pentaurelia]